LPCIAGRRRKFFSAHACTREGGDGPLNGGDDGGAGSEPVLKCPIAHKPDGRFTGWPQTTECAEWDMEPTEGTYGQLYVDYDDEGTLHVLNDWFLRTEPIPGNFYNLFQLTTGGGTQRWMLRVMHNKIHVWRDGKKIGAYNSGAAGFRASPGKADKHTIYEFSLKGVDPGEITMKLGDPGNGTFSSPEEAIVMDPKGYTSVLQAGQPVQMKSTDGPLVIALLPAKAKVGDSVTLQGGPFDTAKGTATVGGAAALVSQWSDESVQLVVPKLSPGGHAIALRRADGATANQVTLLVEACVPACGDNICGDDGCGGVCGTCVAGAICQGGQCVCVPDCTGKECGPNGCAGSCGTCQAGQQCNFGKCECAPSCAGKECGDDGCGGTCGGCIGTAAQCVAGKCQCDKDCNGKQCGDDGCGGTCGSCDATEKCASGVCISS